MKNLNETFALNMAKGTELVAEKQWAFRLWLDYCWASQKYFRVLEVRRTAERQAQLYAQGRTKDGPRVTNLDGYMKISNHQTGLALDVYPLNCSYDDLAEIAKPLGITHPYPSVKGSTFIDQPHFEFYKVGNPPAPFITPEARLKGLLRRRDTSTNPNTIGVISLVIERLKRRLGLS